MKFPQGSAVILAMLVLGTACTPTPQNPSPSAHAGATAVDALAQPSIEKLQIAIIPSDSPAKQRENLAKLATYLTEELGIPVTFTVTKDYDTAVDLLVEGRVEVAYLGPLTYIKAKERNQSLEPLVTHIEKSTGRPWYNSVIVVNSKTGIQELADLQGKRFSFVSPSSTSGFLVPSAMFQKQGIQPQQDFATVEYSGGHDQSLAALKSGKVDAVVVEKPTYLKEVEQGALDADFKIIWESDPIPNPPIVISTQLPEAFKTKLQRALIKAPEGLATIGGIQSAGFTVVQDEDYEPIRQIQAQLDAQN